MLSHPEALFASQEETSRFAQRLGTRVIGRKVVYIVSCTSTQDAALDTLRTTTEQGTVFIAETQIRGRGRRRRRWESLPGSGLLFSFILRPGLLCPTPPYPGLRAAWGVVEGIIACRPETPVFLKWSNDIVSPGTGGCPHKLGGVLVESVAFPEGLGFAVGVGLNVSSPRRVTFANSPLAASCLELETGVLFDRQALLRAVLARIDAALDPAFDNAALAAALRKRLFDFDGRDDVVYRTPAGDLGGRVVTVTEVGDGKLALRFQTPAGETTCEEGHFVGFRGAGEPGSPSDPVKR